MKEKMEGTKNMRNKKDRDKYLHNRNLKQKECFKQLYAKYFKNVDKVDGFLKKREKLSKTWLN